VVFNQNNQDIFFKTTKSVGIQLKFLTTYKMSLGIENLIDFNEFFCGIDYVRLFSWNILIQQSHTNSWDFVILSQILFCSAMTVSGYFFCLPNMILETCIPVTLHFLTKLIGLSYAQDF